MLCGKETLVVNEKPHDQKRIANFSEDALERNVFEIVQFDIEVPDHLYVKFSEMTPLFLVQETPECNILKKMKACTKKSGREIIKGKKRLLAVMKEKKIV